jgi:hypothetical protein
MYHAQFGQLLNGQNVAKCVMVVFRSELSHVTIVILVIACQPINQWSARRVMYYHAHTGQLVNGQNVQSRAMVVLKNELCLVRTVMLLHVYPTKNHKNLKVVQTYHVQNGQLLSGHHALSLVMVAFKQEL